MTGKSLIRKKGFKKIPPETTRKSEFFRHERPASWQMPVARTSKAYFFGMVRVWPGRIIEPERPLALRSEETEVPLRLAMEERESPFFTV